MRKHALYIKTIITSIFLAGNILCAFAQRQPIQVSAYMMPPYSLTLSDYSKIGSQQLVINIQVNDLNISNLPVKLHITMETTAGVSVETMPTLTTLPIYLNGGMTHILFGDDLRDYFNINNLIFKGYSKTDYQRNGQLPEGFYRFSIDVLHYGTNRPISGKGTVTAWIALGKPPVLKAPETGAELGQIPGVPLVFSWLPSNVGAPVGTLNYHFEMWEMRIPGIDPNVVAASIPVFYSKTLYGMTSLVAHPAEMFLEQGMKYAWRVTAEDPTGRVPFAQKGRSEIRTFIYKAHCDTVTDFTVKRLGRDVTFSWTPAKDHTSFNVETQIPATGWFKSLPAYNNKISYSELDYGSSFQMRVQGVCNGNPEHVSDFTEWLTVTVPEKQEGNPGCPECECGDPKPALPVTTQNLRHNIQSGDTLIDPYDGGSRYIVKTVEKQADGKFKGRFLFWAEIWNLKFLCDYWNLSVNTDNQILTMNYKGVQSSKFLIDIDVIGDYLKKLDDTLKKLSDDIDNTLAEVKDKYDKGEIPQDAYDDLVKLGEEAKKKAVEAAEKEKEAIEKKQEMEKNPTDENREKYEEAQIQAQKATEESQKSNDAFKEKAGMLGVGKQAKPKNDFFDGMIQYEGNSSALYLKPKEIPSIQMETEKAEIDSISVFHAKIDGQPVDFYFVSNLENLQQLYDEHQEGYALFSYYDKGDKTLSYKIKYSDTFFNEKYGIKREEYVEAFNKMLSYYTGENDPANSFPQTALSLNEMLNSAAPAWEQDKETSGSLVDYLMRIVDFLRSCKGYNPKEALVPNCFWESSVAAAYPCGIVDGVWDIVFSTSQLIEVNQAFDITGLYFFTPQARETRQVVISVVGSLLSVVKSPELLSAARDSLIKSGKEYIDETADFTPQAAYNQGKLIINIASLFIGAGEIKAISSGANVFKVVAASARNMGNSLVHLTKGIGKLAKTGYVKTVKAGKTVILKTLLDVEIARFGDDGILQINKWIDEPVEIVGKLGDGAIHYSRNGVQATEELVLVKDKDGLVGIGKGVTQGKRTLITEGLETLNGIKAFRMSKGINSSKVVVIGRNMDDVILYKQGLETKGFKVEIFENTPNGEKIISEAAEKQWTDYKKKGKWLTDSEVLETIMYKDNKEWIERMVREGYDIYDIGNLRYLAGEGMDRGWYSAFYNMETSIVFH